jgi:hypothetical protein
MHFLQTSYNELKSEGEQISHSWDCDWGREKHETTAAEPVARLAGLTFVEERIQMPMWRSNSGREEQETTAAAPAAGQQDWLGTGSETSYLHRGRWHYLFNTSKIDLRLDVHEQNWLQNRHDSWFWKACAERMTGIDTQDPIASMWPRLKIWVGQSSSTIQSTGESS